MGKLHLYNTEIPLEALAHERAMLYQSYSPERKFNELLALIETARILNNGEPLKKPQGKGIIISKQK
ncbi:hypothetical protein [Taibaiella soli]|uniref:Uncharacterized protein n=1 Tax=Taibaiella soli TaxID=1649169 RepID=A0A2W2AMG2_9BACT|nr:hypothetical protein [Taibaiella soli]PZF73500.1 hypothetical protein DN068_07180 [Taibaiella soli]